MTANTISFGVFILLLSICQKSESLSTITEKRFIRLNSPISVSTSSTSLFSIPKKVSVATRNHLKGIHNENSNDNQEEIVWVQNLSSRNDGFIDSDKPEVSIMSWNILAQNLYDGHYYKKRLYHQNEHLDWSARRWSMILETVKSLDSDILCLQEVEPNVYELDLKPVLSSLGYEGIYLKKHSKNAKITIGVTTFWKSNKFILTHSKSRSRTLTTYLQSKIENRTLVVINCHLEGHPQKVMERVTQLYHSLRDVTKYCYRNKQKHEGLIICGDFNSPLSQSACTRYLLRQKQDNGINFEFGHIPIPKDIEKIPFHEESSLVSAYPLQLSEDFFTFCAKPNQAFSGLDQVWYSKKNFSSSPPTLFSVSSDERKYILETGLPNDRFPSDHLPVGCILKWKTSSRNKNGKKNSKIPLSNRKQTLKLIPICDIENPFEEAKRIINNVSKKLTKDQRKEFDSITTPIPDLKWHQRPTPGQRHIIDNHRKRRTQLLQYDIQDESVRLDLLRVWKLKREAYKRLAMQEMNHKKEQ